MGSQQLATAQHRSQVAPVAGVMDFWTS